MAIYRTINLSFWTDSKVDDDFTPEDKYFYLYLLTNPQTNICGCYEVSIKQMSNQTGYNKDTIERLLKRFEEVHHVIEYSKSTKEILMLNWHRYNWNKSPKMIAAIESVAKYIKSKKFRDYIFHLVDDLKNDRVSRYPMDTSVSVSVTDYSSDISNNTKSNIKTREQIGMDIINAVWKDYPRKENKNGISKKAKEAIAKIGLEEMQRAVKRYVDAVKGKDKQYVLMGSTFFNGRYVDYLDENWEQSHPESKPKPKKNKYEGLDKVVELLEDESNFDAYMEDRKSHEGQSIDNGYWIPKGGLAG